MKNLNEKFTDAEYTELNRLKNFIGLPWHDLLLRIFREGEKTATELLLAEGHTKEEIEEMFTEK
ncbi:MAG: hypothetical protein KAQ89_00205 [Planctomycetes bacterium]|nr:hypothetical protein [Planctomycetota bacterium]